MPYRKYLFEERMGKYVQCTTGKCSKVSSSWVLKKCCILDIHLPWLSGSEKYYQVIAID